MMVVMMLCIRSERGGTDDDDGQDGGETVFERERRWKRPRTSIREGKTDARMRDEWISCSMERMVPACLCLRSSSNMYYLPSKSSRAGNI